MDRVPTNKTYLVRNVSDFTEIPIELIGYVLADFKEFLALLYAIKMQAEKINKTLPSDWAHFEWKDDGILGLTEFKTIEE